MLVIAGVMSGAYLSLSLLIAAVGVFTAQMRRQGKRRRTKPGETKEPSHDDAHADGKIWTAAWFVVLLVWAATLAYAVYIRYVDGFAGF